MKIYELLLLVIKYMQDEEGGVRGENYLQSLVYFLSSFSKTKNKLQSTKYANYYYGPYSSELNLGLEELKEVGLVGKTTDTHINSNLGIDSASKLYKYELTRMGIQVAENIEKQNPKTAELIEEYLEKITKLSSSCGNIKKKEVTREAQNIGLYLSNTDATITCQSLNGMGA